jgi:hypothetical protein
MYEYIRHRLGCTILSVRTKWAQNSKSIDFFSIKESNETKRIILFINLNEMLILYL